MVKKKATKVITHQQAVIKATRILKNRHPDELHEIVESLMGTQADKGTTERMANRLLKSGEKHFDYSL